MNIMTEVRQALERAGYETTWPRKPSQVIYFEDDTIFGFVSCRQSAAEILDIWKSDQRAFLLENRARMGEVASKAWNAYAVFLTEADCPTELRGEFLQIEEDFQGARKIAKAGVRGVEDVERAIAPLIPVRAGHLQQSLVAHFPERIRSHPGIADAVKRLLLDDATGARIAEELMAES